MLKCKDCCNYLGKGEVCRVNAKIEAGYWCNGDLIENERGFEYFNKPIDQPNPDSLKLLKEHFNTR